MYPINQPNTVNFVDPVNQIITLLTLLLPLLNRCWFTVLNSGGEEGLRAARGQQRRNKPDFISESI